MRYQDLARVQEENERILHAIHAHAKGGPPPAIDGLTPDARKLLMRKSTRQTSREFANSTFQILDSLDRLREHEAKVGKRPTEVLSQNVQATSQLIAAYVSRLQWMVEHPA